MNQGPSWQAGLIFGWLISLLCGALVLASTGRAASNVVAAADALTELFDAPRQIQHDVWTTEDGLPQNTVHSLVQTRDGYLWLGTRAGLARFDGQKFKVFNRANTPEFVSDDCVSLAEDATGTLWIGTLRGLLTLEDGRFSRLPFGYEQTNESQRVWSLLAARDGSVWAGGSHKFAQFRNGTNAGSWGINNVYNFHEDRAGQIWIATKEGLFRFDATANAPVPALPEFRHIIRSLGEDASGALWIGSNARHLARLERGQLEVFSPPPEQVPSKPFFSLYPARDGAWWVGTKEGLYQFADRQFVPVRTPRGLVDFHINRMLVDAEGALWLGTQSDGLHRLRWMPIITLAKRDGMVGQDIRSIRQTRNGHVWIGTEAGASVWTGAQFVNYTTNSGLISSTATAICENHDGAVWISGNRGLTLLRNGLVAERRFREDTPELYGINALHVARDGAVWFAADSGLGCLQSSNVTFFNQGFSSVRVQNIREDARGTFWLGTRSGGVNQFREGQVSVLTPPPALTNVPMIVHTVEADGTAWVGTDRGLVRLRDGEYRLISPAHGLPDDWPLALLEDERTNFWISSHQGIYRVPKEALNAVADGKTNFVQCVRFGTDDGLLSTEGNLLAFPSGCKTRDGHLWFATIKGVAVVDPRRIPLTNAPVFVNIEEVRADNRVVSRSIRSGSVLRPPLELEPGSAHVLELRFLAPNFTAWDKVRFKYRMEGLDKDWTESGDARSAFYTALRPGRYTFHVTASDHHGVWSENTAAFAFIVQPFFWQTWPFYGLCAVGLFGSTYGLHRWRLRYYRKLDLLHQQLAMERERLRMANDIHDDVGSRLLHLSVLGELVERHLRTPVQAQLHLGKLKAATQAIFRAMDEIVWTVNPRQDTLGGFASYVREFALEFLEPAGIRCRFDFPTPLPSLAMPAELRHQLFLAVKETLNNVLKHAGASEVWLRLRYRGGALTLAIEDNGCGFDPQARLAASDAPNHGLSSLRDRLATLRGECRWTSAPGQGTTVVLEVSLEQSGLPPAPEGPLPPASSGR